ncbi:2-dehydropantoate 2-reductase [Streptomyces sp. NPDC002825]|uniref:ketopantoate reductase family protein n=1 Tax=Streptomyces sp. NPDC002825 TaxID=3154666 RepID=UPI00332AABFC
MLGAGGVGLALAAELARSGGDVTLVMREPTLAAYEGAVRVRRPSGEDTATPVPAVAVLAEPVDVLWIAVKEPQLASALRTVTPDSVTGALVVPLLNGVDHMPFLQGEFGDRAAVGAIRVEAWRAAVGEVVRESLFMEIELAAPRGHARDALAADLKKAGIGLRVTGDAESDRLGVLWRKLVVLAPLALATTGAGGPVEAVRRDSAMDELMKDCAREACAVATALGARIDADRTVRLLDLLPGRTTSSLERDLREGSLGELDAIGGAVLRAGTRTGVPTPATRTLVDRARRLHAAAR